MTVTSAANKAIFPGNGAQTVFTFAFNNAWDGTAGNSSAAMAALALLYTDASGNQTTLVRGAGASQYQLALNAPVPPALWGVGGTVTYNPSGTPIAAGTTLALIRTLPLTQTVSLQNQASFGQYASAAEQMGDRLEMQGQQQAELYGRAIVVNPADASAPAPLPPVAQRANQGMGFDAFGNPVAIATPASGVISTAMQPVVDAASIPAGRTALGLGAMATEGIGAALQDDGSGNARVNFAIDVIAASTGVHAANHLQQLVCTEPLTLTLDRAHTLWSGFGCWVYAAVGEVTIAPNASDAFEGLSSGMSITLPVGQWVFITTDALSSGTWYVNGVTLSGANAMSPLNVKAFGAKGDGSTDDTSAIQAAIAAAAGGGTVYFPSGSYKVTSTIIVGAGINLLGATGDNAGMLIASGGADIEVIRINGFSASMEYIDVAGGGIGASHAAVRITSGAVEVPLRFCRISGGLNAVLIDTNGVSDVTMIGCHVESAYGTAVVRIVNGPSACCFIRHKGDQNYPVSTPANGAALNGRGASTHYNVGDIASSGGYYLQARVAGTTASGGGPTLQNYGVDIVDGGVTWRLVAPTTYYSLQVDTDSFSNCVFEGDFTGPFTAGIAMTNTGAGTAPSTLRITDSFMGANITAGFLGAAGNDVIIKGCQIQSPISGAGVGVLLNGSWGGDSIIEANTIFSCPTGIDVSAGTNTIIKGNQIFAATTAAVNIDAAITKFVIDGNMLGTSATWGPNQIGVNVATGASDYYNIVNNIVHGASTGVSDGGSGSNKTVSGNH